MRNDTKPLLFGKKQLGYLIVAVSLTIIIAGYFYYNFERNKIVRDKYAELKAISELKINQIEQWLQARIGDADVAARSPFFSLAINSWLKNRGDERGKNKILNRLLVTKVSYGYEDIMLASTKGQILLALTDTSHEIDTSTMRFIKEAVNKKSLVLSYFYKCTRQNTIHFDFINPLLDGNKKVTGVLIFRVNPYDYLYPLIQSWPTPSKTAETLLVVKHGDSVLFLNELKFKKNSAMNFEIPLSHDEVPAVAGVKGKSGIFEGKDYRGVEVISDLRTLPETPWVIVAKVDREEIFSDLNYVAILIIGFVAILLLLANSVVAWVYHYRQRNIFKQLFVHEKNLRETQEEFRTTLYSIGDAVITTDTSGIVKHMNRIGEELTGWNEAEANGKLLTEVFKIINEETRKDVESPVQRVLEEGAIVGLANHTILVSKSGKEIPIEDSGSPIKNKDGEIVGVVLVFRDQTEERAANKTLQESEQRYRSLFENMLNGFAYCKMIYENDEPEDFIYLSVNSAFEKLTGLKNAVGRKVSELIPGIKRLDPGLFNIYGRVARTGFPEQFETYLESLNMWFSVSVYSPEPEYFVAVFDVITKRKLAEKELKESEERFRRTFELAAVGKSLTSLEGKLTNVNESFCKMLGYSKEELAALSFIDITYPDDIERSVAVVKGLLNSEKESYRIDKRYIKKDGSILWADVSTMLLRDTEGKPQFFVTHIVDITGSKLSKEQLVQSEKKYRYLFENNPEPMWVYDLETLAFLEVNQAAIINYGYSKEEFSKMTLKDIRPEEDVAALLKDVAATTNEYNFAGQWRHKKKNGEIIFVEIISHLVEYENREARLVLIRDVTERKAAEKEINLLNSKLQQLISSIKELSSAHTLEAVQRIVASSARNLNGADGATIVFRDGDKCFYADEDAIAPLWKGKRFPLTSCISGWVMLNDKVASIEDIYQDERIPIDAYRPTFVKSLAMVPVKTTEPLAAIGNYWKSMHKASDLEIQLLQTLADAASRAIENVKLFNELESRVEERTNELHDTLKFIETIVESSSTGLTVFDQTGRCTMTNKSAFTIIGATKEAMLKQNYHKIESWKKSGLYRAATEAVMWNEPRQVDAHLITTFDKEVWIDCVFIPFISKNQTNLLLIMNDISGRVKREEKIKELNKELKSQTERLIAANKELEAFSYSVSHDLRAPLRAIDGFTGMLVNGYASKLDSEGLRICTVIQDNAKKMGQLIDDLLAFSRLSRAEMSASTVDMKTLAHSIYYEMADEVARRKIEFVLGNLVPVNGDPNMIRQVWVNLISNAVKFTSKKEKPRIEITNVVEDHSITYIVKDNGAGFSMKYVGKLFGVFQRLHSIKEFEGTGVGLAIVQRIIFKHGGKVWAEGEVDKGSTFYFSLPK